MAIKIVKQTDLHNLDEIVELNEAIFRNLYTWEPYSQEQYTRRLAGKRSVMFLVKDDGNYIGYSLSFSEGEAFHIWILGILPQYREKGLATQLLCLNEEYAMQHGFKEITVNVYNVSPVMQILLIRRGYQIIGVESSPLDTKYNEIHFKRYLDQH